MISRAVAQTAPYDELLFRHSAQKPVMISERNADKPHALQAAVADQRRLSPALAFAVFFALACCWLACSTLLVNIDLFDGYSTIANSQYFLNGSGDYFWQRGPLMAWLLTPAEYLAQRLDLNELDVRPHHLEMAVLHAVYLWSAWQLLHRNFGGNWITLIAYLAAIPSFVFFSYAPFISHDIFPGVLVLLMVTLAHRYLRVPTNGLWLTLFGVGAALTLIKQTYALVWPAVIVAAVVQWAVHGRSTGAPFRRIISLALAAAASALVSWSIYASALATTFPEVAFWARPIELARAVSMLYLNEGPPREIFYQAVYFKNLWAYGLTAMALVLPGLGIALTQRGTLLQSIALVWSCLLLALMVIPVKEVRYLAFLSPLTAALLIPVLTQLWSLRTSYRFAILGLLLIDGANVLPEALRIRQGYYRDSVIDFFMPIADFRNRPGDIYFERYLSFVSPDRSAFYGDRYHRITHIDAELISALYGIPRQRFHRLDMSTLPDRVAQASTDDVFLLATSIAARVRPFRPGNVEAIEPGFIQSISRAENFDFRREGEHYLLSTPAAAPVVLPLTTEGHSSLFIVHDQDRIAADSPVAALAADTGSGRRQPRGLVVWSMCTLAGCENFARVATGRQTELQ